MRELKAPELLEGVRDCPFCTGKLAVDRSHSRPRIQHSKPTCKKYKHSRDVYAFIAKMNAKGLEDAKKQVEKELKEAGETKEKTGCST